jgi:hypothetical protein
MLPHICLSTKDVVSFLLSFKFQGVTLENETETSENREKLPMASGHAFLRQDWESVILREGVTGKGSLLPPEYSTQKRM